MMRCTRLTMIVAGLTVSVMGSGLLAQETKKPEETKPTQPPSVVQPKKDEKKVDAPAPAKEQVVYVQLQTSMGDILLELNQTKAPISVANFLHYVDKGFYSGTIFHRVINGFMVQGGGFTQAMEQKKADDPIKNEYTNGLKNESYTVAMARTNLPDSATAQFYINVADNDALDRASPRTGGAGYAVFGKVVAGKDVVDKIKAVKTGLKQTPQGQMTDVPVETVTINTAKKLTEDEAAKIKNGGSTAKPAAGGTGAGDKPADAPKTTEPKKPDNK
jgi:peptidyl-prolyl cis-trans isomerase B (cyclophilin B)